MSQYIQGLWIGSGLTREAAHEVERAIEYHLELDEAFCKLPQSVKTELMNLANAVRSEIQKLPPPPKPMSDLV